MHRRGHLTALALTAALALVLGATGVAQAATPGTLDPSFAGGVVALGADTQLFGVAVQANGEVVAAGQSGGTALVERFTTAGQPDSTFAGGQVSAAGSVANSVAIQPDGKIVVAGNGAGGMFVERFNSNGTPDTSFGSGGVARAFIGSGGAASAVALAPNGAIVVAGCVGQGQCNPQLNTQIALARFNSNGSPDTSFGSGGAEVLGELGLPYAAATGVAVQPDGRIVFAGYEQGSTTYAYFNGLVGRLTTSGALDTSFSGGGVFNYHQPGGGFTSFTSVALQNNGDVVAAGADAGGPHAVFVRLTSSGTADSSFGSGGSAVLPSGSSTNLPYGAYGVGIAGGGRIVGGGALNDEGTSEAAIWALTASGAADAEGGFAGGTAVDPTLGLEACALAVAPDGSLVIAGTTASATSQSDPCTLNGSSSAFVARYIGFGPPPPPSTSSAPAVTTGGASAITQVSATVGGDVNPDGLASVYTFDYGPTSAYGLSTPVASVPAGTSSVAVSATLTGLTAGTVYHYRIEATNADGTADGTDLTFTAAPAGPPKATTGAASSVTEVSASVGGQVNPDGLATTYKVEYGKTTAYGATTPTANLTAAASALVVSAKLARLRPGTTYHYRLIAANADGIGYGSDRTFKTEPRLRASLHGVSKSYLIATVISSGISLSVKCNQACSTRGSLLISAATAKLLGLGKHQVTIGSGSGSIKHSGTVHLHLKLSKAAKLALANHHSLSVTLDVVSKPTGGSSVKSTKGLKFKS